MPMLWKGLVVRPGLGLQGSSPVCQVVRCAAADPNNKGTQHGFRGPSRRGLSLGQPHRDFSNQLPHALVLDSLELNTKTLQNTLQSLLECQSSIDERGGALGSTLARNGLQNTVRCLHVELGAQWNSPAYVPGDNVCHVLWDVVNLPFRNRVLKLCCRFLASDSKRCVDCFM
jgi:hypothetical protein